MVVLALPGAREAAAATPLPGDVSLVLTGGGWGHGHGMSQYGARAQAEAGRTWRQILHSYYTGVDIVTRAQETMRVLLDTASAVVAGGPETIVARWSGGASLYTTNSTYRYLRVHPTSTGVALYKAAGPGGPWYQVTAGSQNIRFTRPDGGPVPLVSGSRIEYYRGLIEAYRRSSSSLYAINQLKMDSYLYGVVPRESPASWHMNALRAQAVAARSYSTWKKDHSSGAYHICASTMCQVYGGYGYRSSPTAGLVVTEASRTNQAVNDTSGVTMTSGGEAIFAEFHSSSGGHTAQGSRSYLAPVPDPWDKTYSPNHRWSAIVPISTVEDRWPSIGRLVDIANVARDGDGPWGGRVESLMLVGTDANVTVSGNTLRSALGLRSTLFDIDLYSSSNPVQPAEVALSPGETGTAVLRFRNDGNVSWSVGTGAVLATSSPKDHSGLFRAAGWLNASRVTTLDRNVSSPSSSRVLPGQVGEFVFPVTVPATLTSGIHTERYRMLLPGKTWFGPEATLKVRVAFTGASHLGGNLLRNPSFETAGTGLPAWARSDTSAIGRSTVASVDAASAAKLRGSGTTTRYLRQSVTTAGSAGDRYVVSAWSKGASTTAGGGAVEAVLTVRHAAGTSTAALSFPTGSHGWTYRETALEVPAGHNGLTVTLAVRAPQSGAVWFDRVRLVRESVANPGFDAGTSTPAAWELLNAGTSDGRETRIVRAGTAALRLRGASGSTVSAAQEIVTAGSAGSTWRLAGWNRSSGTSAGGGALQLSAHLRHADGTTSIVRTGFPRASHEWLYGETLFAPSKGFVSVRLTLSVASQSGTVWFDEVSLAPARGSRALDANGGFELGSPVPGDWSLVNASAGVSASAVSGSTSLSLAGAADKTVAAVQRVPVGGTAGDGFTLSAWNKVSSSDPAGGAPRALAVVHHTDGTTDYIGLSFAIAPHDWVRAQTAFTTVKPYRRIVVYAQYPDQSGTAWFDEVLLAPVRI